MQMSEEEKDDFVVESVSRIATALESIQRLLFQLVELQKESKPE